MSVTSLAGCPLPAHDPDPDDPDNRIPPGRWAKVACAAADSLRWSEGVHVWSSLTDLDGQYGGPVVFTAWGDAEGVRPILAEARWPNRDGSRPDDRPCEHYAYEVTP